jgi:hypothetical protein
VLDGPQDPAFRLRPGMSVIARVYTRSGDGETPADAVTAPGGADATAATGAAAAEAPH